MTDYEWAQRSVQQMLERVRKMCVCEWLRLALQARK